MGSQTLEILRQGVWASLTGGWFYDPHQDVFCNTFHLYVWLFLLCLPFSIYVYFPPTKYIWYVYCALVTVALTAVKLINYGLHHMYDTTECVREIIDEDWSGTSKREEEGIELQVLSNKTSIEVPQSSGVNGSIVSYFEAGNTDGDSVEFSEFQQLDNAEAGKPVSVIDLKAEVHRKNSSESSEDVSMPPLEVVTYQSEIPEVEKKPVKSERRPKHQRSKTDGFVKMPSSKNDARHNRSSFRKVYHQGSSDSQESSLLQHRPSLNSVGSEDQSNSESVRRHSNFTNSSLNFLPPAPLQEIKPTGSLELAFIDNNPNQALVTDGFYFKPNKNGGGVRRIRSAAIETCCPPLTLSAHPNSLEVIGCKSTKNPLPPPSTSLVRHHLKLCQYFGSGSEIVYPIAEQSDEHQTSHGPDTDLDSLTHNSDSDFDNGNEGSHSPLIYIKLRKLANNVPYEKKFDLKSDDKQADDERTSATSKDALLDNDNSNSSVTPEMQDARTDCYGTDNDISEKKLSECSNLSCSNTSLECEEKEAAVSEFKPRASTSKAKYSDNPSCSSDRAIEGDFKVTFDVDIDDSGMIEDNKFDRQKSTGLVRKDAKRIKKKKGCVTRKASDAATCSSLVELDLDWLFEGGGELLQHRKEPLKRDTEWSSTTTVSLEHDVSKVLQEPVPSTRSLGAIPKKTRLSSNRQFESATRKTPKSESDKCSMCRCKSENSSDEKTLHRQRSMKENKVTQTFQQLDSPVEGLECIIFPPQKLHRVNVSRSMRSRSRSEAPIPSNSHNELSTLLPQTQLIQTFLAPGSACLPAELLKAEECHRNRVRRNRANRHRSSQKVKRDNAIACSLSAGHGTHGAKSFNDTTDGAVHCFLDERGNWITYTFDEKGIGTANTRVTDDRLPAEKVSRRRLGRRQSEPRNTAKVSDIWDSNSTDSICNSSVSIILDAPPVKSTNSMIPVSQNSVNLHAVQLSRSRRPLPEPYRRHIALADHNAFGLAFMDNSIILQGNEPDIETSIPRNRFKIIQATDTVNNNYPRTKSYYKFKMFPWTFVKVSLDRLKLLALLDRNLTLRETIFSTILGILVSIFGAILLYLGFYEDLLAFIFCFVMASSQYSLLKSVQPDAASPTHGFNRIIAYSRPVYFCLISLIILILHINRDKNNSSYYYYGNTLESSSCDLLNFEVCNQIDFVSVRDFLIKFILFFPLLFSFGLFPQINTFVMYILEQIDMHIFGGNAMSSLTAAFYCIFRSILVVILLTCLAYSGLSESKTSQHILFSIFCSCLIATSYHLSRSTSDPCHIWNIIKHHISPDVYREHRNNMNKTEDVFLKEEMTPEYCSAKIEKKVKPAREPQQDEKMKKTDHVDPLPHKLQKTVNARLKNDVIVCGFITVFVFGIHASTVFTALQPELSPILWSIAVALGFALHYIIPQLRKQLPWLCIAKPILRSHEHGIFQIRGPAKIMWFERVYVYFCFFEKNILYPLVFLSTITADSPRLSNKYGTWLGALIVVICGLKCLRNSYSEQNSQYLILTFAALYFKYDRIYCHDHKTMQDTFIDKYFLMSIFFQKIHELLLKIQFVITYIAPWQITWGSAFHAFAQPFSVPHSAMLFSQAIVSAILSTPLNPFLGSAIFLTSYVRPVKFWERDYNTRRVDHSNTPLSSHLDRNLGADDNNLNSIFYEHLTRSLQHSLCGDIMLGRWGAVNQGDCFVLASDYLNCLVHIIEVGNGLVTFQMRGLEFRGTYCQQREVEAITEDVEENDGCCCCDTGHLPNMLSVNAAFSQRWLAWEVTNSKYILEGYSISDNNAVSMLQVFEFRKVLVSYYVKSIIFYTVRSPKLEEWLNSQTILKALQPMQDRWFVDLDPVFNYNIDEDFDIQNNGMTRQMFCQVHGEWISYCVEKTEKNIDTGNNSILVVLCFALTLLGRRTLGAVSHNTVSSVEFFLYGLHALFKGDFRITCARDEWVFTDMDLLKTIVAPGVRMSLKLHQDHFMTPDEYEELPALFDAICKHEEDLVISHEGDPAWRNAVLSGTPSLLALRHVLDEGADEYKIIMLNKCYLSFRVIKINKECVRGLWAGQQQELVYLRNRNPERGSIQNAKQALRNIINSSCDQPIGYPIYVSPLTTSYAETSEQYCQLIGGSVSLGKIRNFFLNIFKRIRKRCRQGCSSGGTVREDIGMGNEGVYSMTQVTGSSHHNNGSREDGSHLGGSMGRGSSLSRTSLGGNRGSLVSMGKPTSSTLASLAGLFKERDERAVSQAPDAMHRHEERTADLTDDKDHIHRVKILDPNLVYDAINLGRRIDVCWPTEYMRIRGGRSHWKDWIPEVGMEGPVVHKWTPCHKDPSRRSHVDRTIFLIQIDDKFVPIAESGVQTVTDEM